MSQFLPALPHCITLHPRNIAPLARCRFLLEAGARPTWGRVGMFVFLERG